MSVRLSPSLRFVVLNTTVSRAMFLVNCPIVRVLCAPQAKSSRCLWYFGSCLSLLFPYEGHVLCGYVVYDRFARPKCTVPVVGNP